MKDASSACHHRQLGVCTVAVATWHSGGPVSDGGAGASDQLSVLGTRTLGTAVGYHDQQPSSLWQHPVREQ